MRLLGGDYRKFLWHLDASVMDSPGGFLNPKDVCNFVKSTPRSSCRDLSCIMCGASDVSIPSQNKKVCKNCDSSFWLWTRHQVVFKFCKGCKNFCFLADFDDRPEGTKCTKCRQRSREWYHSKKGSEDNASPHGSCEADTPRSLVPTPAEYLVRSASTSALPDSSSCSHRHVSQGSDELPPVPTLVLGDAVASKRSQLSRKRSLSALEDAATDGLRSVNHRAYKKLVFSPVANSSGEPAHVFVTPGGESTKQEHQDSADSTNSLSFSAFKRPSSAPSVPSGTSFFPAPAENDHQITPLFATPAHPYSNSHLASSGSTTSGKRLSLSAFTFTKTSPTMGGLSFSAAGEALQLPLHQVTPQGYPILVPPQPLSSATAASSSGTKKRASRKAVMGTGAVVAAAGTATWQSPTDDEDFRLHRLPSSSTTKSAVALAKAEARIGSHYSHNNHREEDHEDDEEDDAEVERLTSETFDRLVSAHETAEQLTVGLLLSCRNSQDERFGGLPPRLSLPLPTSHTTTNATMTTSTTITATARSPALTRDLSTSTASSRPDTACSLTYSEASSPTAEYASSSQRSSSMRSLEKENLYPGTETSSVATSLQSSRNQSPFQAHATASLATVTVSKTTVKGIAMVGSPPGEPSLKQASLVSTAAGAEHQVTPDEPRVSDEAPAGQAKWQWDPKHNPLALLSDIF